MRRTYQLGGLILSKRVLTGTLVEAPMPAFKKIKDYTGPELDQAVEKAVDACARHAEYMPGFYEILNGIDAYFERRRRKERETIESDHSLLVKDLKDSLGKA